VWHLQLNLYGEIIHKAPCHDFVMTLTSSSQTTKPPTQREKRLALIEVGELATLTVARYPLGLRLPAGPFLSMPAPAAAGKIFLEENKHGQRRVTARRARPRCLVANRTRAPCAESQAPWGSWVSLAQYPGALAAPTAVRAVPSAHQHQYQNQLAPVLVPGATCRVI